MMRDLGRGTSTSTVRYTVPESATTWVKIQKCRNEENHRKAPSKADGAKEPRTLVVICEFGLYVYGVVCGASD